MRLNLALLHSFPVTCKTSSLAESSLSFFLPVIPSLCVQPPEDPLLLCRTEQPSAAIAFLEQPGHKEEFTEEAIACCYAMIHTCSVYQFQTVGCSFDSVRQSKKVLNFV